MGKFLDSDIIRKEMEDILSIQKKLYSTIINFPSFTDEQKSEHINEMMKLLEKQEVMWARISLSDDPDALEMKQKIKVASAAMGFGDADVHHIFKGMRTTLEKLKSRLK